MKTELEKQIDDILHPERNGVLVKESVSEGASYEHIIKHQILDLINQQTTAAYEQGYDDRSLEADHEIEDARIEELTSLLDNQQVISWDDHSINRTAAYIPAVIAIQRLVYLQAKPPVERQS